jgi:hypothetical protein
MNIIERYMNDNIFNYLSDFKVAKRKDSAVMNEKEYSVILTFVNSLDSRLIKEYLLSHYDVISFDTSFYDNRLNIKIEEPLLSYFRYTEDGEGVAEIIARKIYIKHEGVS